MFFCDLLTQSRRALIGNSFLNIEVTVGLLPKKVKNKKNLSDEYNT